MSTCLWHKGHADSPSISTSSQLVNDKPIGPVHFFRPAASFVAAHSICTSPRPLPEPLCHLLTRGVSIGPGQPDLIAQDALPILNIVLPHSPHLPRVAALPFFIVTCCASCISRLSRHFMQYPVIESPPETRSYADGHDTPPASCRMRTRHPNYTTKADLAEFIEWVAGF